MILVGVCGGIAAYKSCELVRLLVKDGHEVQVVQTPDSRRFVGPTTFAALSRRPVLTDGGDDVFPHLDASKAAELLCIAPLTATTMARIAHGEAANVLAATALAVRLDSKGPILFKQRRYGFNNELIEIYKFRSMYVALADADATRLVSKGDPRVTLVGRFIRKTSLDELPQLFNVLKGDLSLVGPRPHATQAKAQEALYEQVVDGYFARHRVRPGITGWAQINGWRGETDTKEKIEQRVLYDLDYIDRWSLGFDLYILARTPLALLKTQNAY